MASYEATIRMVWSSWSTRGGLVARLAADGSVEMEVTDLIIEAEV